MKARNGISVQVQSEGKQRSNTHTVLLFSLLVLVRVPLLSRNMAKENTFLPLNMGEASAETLQSLVSNTTNQDRNPDLS